MNLLVNSRDAMPNGGRLSIETKNANLDAAYSKNHFGVPPGQYVMLAVSDSGIGMTPETQARIFEPFFTTKEAGQGTGLGLATVYGIVKQSGGYIWVYSEPFKGTTFKIYFPAVTGKAEPLPATEAKPVTGSGVVMVIEDEPTVREMVCEMLESLGYTAIEAGSADEATRLVHENKQIEVVLVDLIMPGVGGPEMVARIRKLRPQIPVVFMSGYSDRASQVQELGPDALFLQKPFSEAALSQKINKAVERKG
jgi:CheY-like chemotaxis protein